MQKLDRGSAVRFSLLTTLAASLCLLLYACGGEEKQVSADNSTIKSTKTAKQTPRMRLKRPRSANQQGEIAKDESTSEAVDETTPTQVSEPSAADQIPVTTSTRVGVERIGVNPGPVSGVTPQSASIWLEGTFDRLKRAPAPNVDETTLQEARGAINRLMGVQVSSKENESAREEIGQELLNVMTFASEEKDPQRVRAYMRDAQTSLVLLQKAVGLAP